MERFLGWGFNTLCSKFHSGWGHFSPSYSTIPFIKIYIELSEFLKNLQKYRYSRFLILVLSKYFKTYFVYGIIHVSSYLVPLLIHCYTHPDPPYPSSGLEFPLLVLAKILKKLQIFVTPNILRLGPGSVGPFGKSVSACTSVASRLWGSQKLKMVSFGSGYPGDSPSFPPATSSSYVHPFPHFLRLRYFSTAKNSPARFVTEKKTTIGLYDLSG